MVTLFAIVDRQVFVLLAEPIRIALKLSDFQLGLLQGTGVAIFGGLAAYPIAWMADRLDRRLVLAGSVFAWSVFVVCCGFARNFVQLLVASSLVGAGEAGLSPLTFALIPDLFDRRQRQLANSIFALASAASGALGLVICGQIVTGVASARPTLPAYLHGFADWQLSFFAAAAPAPIMLLVVATLRAPRRAAATQVVATGPSTRQEIGDASIWTFLKQHRFTFGGMYVGFGLSNLGYAALSSWIVVICMRSFHTSAAQVGGVLGLASLVAVAIGLGVSVLLTRVLADRIGPALPIRMIRIGVLITAGLIFSMLFVTSVVEVYGIMFVGYTVISTTGMVLPTAFQNLSPPRHRARLIALQGIVAVAIAAWAPPLVGLLSDRMKQTPHGLIIAVVAVSVPSLIASVLALSVSERSFATTAAAATAVGG
jgi:MFS family permease